MNTKFKIGDIIKIKRSFSYYYLIIDIMKTDGVSSCCYKCYDFQTKEICELYDFLDLDFVETAEKVMGAYYLSTSDFGLQ